LIVLQFDYKDRNLAYELYVLPVENKMSKIVFGRDLPSTGYPPAKTKSRLQTTVQRSFVWTRSVEQSVICSEHLSGSTEHVRARADPRGGRRGGHAPLQDAEVAFWSSAIILIQW